MHISPVSFTQPLAPVQNVAAPAAVELASPIENSVADGVSISSANASENALPTPTLPQSEAEVSEALAAIFSSSSKAEMAEELPLAPAVAPQPQAEPVDVGGFLLAGGTAIAGLSANTEAGATSIPTRDDVANYTYIEPQEATANYEKNVRANLSFVERAVIKSYCTFAYKMMNGYQLGLKKSPTGTIRRANQCMANALNRFEVPAGSVLYRTANINELRNYVMPDDFAKYQRIDEQNQTEKLAQILDQRLTGTQTTRKSFLSTTIDPKYDFEDKPKVATKMYVGANVHGVYVAADDKLSRFPDEQEYLLAPDTKVTVLGVDYNPKNKGMVLHVMLGDLPAGQTATDMLATTRA